ncbi:MAG: outer membrane protein assembly factor BamD [Pseudomonadota bacterium]
MTCRGRSLSWLLAIAVFLCLPLLGGCGSFGNLGNLGSGGGPFKSIFGKSDEVEPLNTDPANVIYGEAEQLADQGKYKEAARQYEEVDIAHPYSREARNSIVMASYSYYRAGKYDEAVSSADRYLTLHPGTREAAMAQNIIAMSYYDRILDPKRDQSFARRSLAAYEKLLQRYPSSQYAADAANRVRILQDLIAASEMQVGRYYLKRSNYLAAINRFKTVVTEYQTTAQVEEALMRLTEAYMALGIVNEAQTAAAVLGHNFPDSKWYKHAYSLLGKRGLEPQQYQGSWISRAWKTRSWTGAGQT